MKINQWEMEKLCRSWTHWEIFQIWRDVEEKEVTFPVGDFLKISRDNFSARHVKLQNLNRRQIMFSQIGKNLLGDRQSADGVEKGEMSKRKLRNT